MGCYCQAIESGDCKLREVVQEPETLLDMLHDLSGDFFNCA